MAEKADVVVNNVTYRDVPGIQLTAAGGGTVTYTLVDYPIAIEKGGTGAATSADALIQLGAVAKSGDTMTGPLTTTYLTVNASQHPGVEFTQNGSAVGTLVFSTSTRRANLREYPSGSSYYEQYYLPTPNTSLSANATYPILTGKAAVTVAQGGTGANNAASALSNLGAVAKSGDTMTGTLTSPEMRVKNDSYPSFYYQTTSGMIGRMLVNHTSHNMSFREMKSGQHFDSFTLPTPTITEETDNYYDIVTTKGNYAMGGTFSASAPISSYHSTTPSFAYKTSASGSPIAESAARANTRQIFFREYASDTAYHEDYLLPEHSTGATGNAIYNIVTTKGDYTMTGRLYASGMYVYAPSSPGIGFRKTATDANAGVLYFDMTNRRYVLRQFAENSSYAEGYVLPVPAVQSEDRWYSILTTKDHPPYTAQTLDWSSSQYITNNYDTWVEKAFDTVRFQGLFNLTGLTANTTITLGTIPEGYRPGHSRSVRTIGVSMTPNWSTPGNIGASFIFVTINTNGVVTVNPGANVVNGGFWIDTTWVI